MSTNANIPNKEEQRKLIIEYVASLLNPNLSLLLCDIGGLCMKKFDWFPKKNIALSDALHSSDRFKISNLGGTKFTCSLSSITAEEPKNQTSVISPSVKASEPPKVTTQTHVLVNSKKTLSQARQDLQNKKVIAADCEGVSLGKNGKLCLVQIAVGSKQYLFDVLVEDPVLRKSMLDLIKLYFESPTVLKIFHDCRQDSSALYHQHGIRLKNVVDCQVLHQFISNNKQERIGLNPLSKQYKVDINPFKDQVQRAIIKNNSMWATRPLTKILIDYAAADVRNLEKLYNAMASKINVTREDIKSACEDYISYYLDTPVQITKPDLEKESTVEQLASGFKIVNQLYLMINLFPQDIRTKIVKECGTDPVENIIEIVMDKGRHCEIFFYNNSIGHSVCDFIVEQHHIDHIADQLQFASDKRAGIEGSLHRISAIHSRHNQIIGLTLRIGRSVIGLASVIGDLIEGGGSILLLGRPGSGKTTVIRDIARIMAETRRVIIVDTSCEIGGFGDVPHVAVGRARRMQVTDIRNQQEVMIQAVQNHTPEVIVIDEIGNNQEVHTARTISQRGVVLCASAHGSMETILNNPVLNKLLGGVENVIVSDRAAEKSQGEKMRLQMKNPPIFDTVVELSDSKDSEWRIYRNVGDTVRKILAGQVYQREVRSFDSSTLEITTRKEDVDPLAAPVK